MTTPTTMRWVPVLEQICARFDGTFTVPAVRCALMARKTEQGRPYKRCPTSYEIGQMLAFTPGVRRESAKEHNQVVYTYRKGRKARKRGAEWVYPEFKERQARGIETVGFQ